MRYCPVPSVITVRVFSMSAGLVASTVTPGRTAADASLTTPAIDAWAKAKLGSSQIAAAAATMFTTRYIANLLRTTARVGRLSGSCSLNHRDVRDRFGGRSLSADREKRGPSRQW